MENLEVPLCLVMLQAPVLGDSQDNRKLIAVAWEVQFFVFFFITDAIVNKKWRLEELLGPIRSKLAILSG